MSREISFSDYIVCLFLEDNTLIPILQKDFLKFRNQNCYVDPQKSIINLDIFCK